jgi:hypothetical protein
MRLSKRIGTVAALTCAAAVAIPQVAEAANQIPQNQCKVAGDFVEVITPEAPERADGDGVHMFCYANPGTLNVNIGGVESVYSGNNNVDFYLDGATTPTIVAGKHYSWGIDKGAPPRRLTKMVIH